METHSTQQPLPNPGQLAHLEKGGHCVVTATYAPLELVTLPTVDTAAAAHYLNRQQQTLRIWACHENGPIRPIRINGRLHWCTASIRKLLGVA